MTTTLTGTERASAGSDVPEAGQLVRIRGQQWVVSDVQPSHQPEDELAAARIPGKTLVTFTSVSDDDLGTELTLVWEVEPDREIVPATQLPEVTATGWDDPQKLGAFLDAVRWGTVTSADANTLQAPFRSGITIEEYQLEPVARALSMPRVNLLIADDVGLGKTIEAGLVVQEMLLRHRARRVIVVAPASLTLKWQEEMEEKFGLGFQILDTEQLKELRRTHGLEANPFQVYPRTIISLQWLRTPRIQRMLDEVLTNETRFPGFFDLLIVDEIHHCAPAEPAKQRGYPTESKQTEAVRRIAEHSQHRLFLSATPHNGYSWSWQSLLEMLDPQRFVKGQEPDKATLDQVMVRRLKTDIKNADGTERFPARHIRAIDIDYTDAEREAYDLLQAYTRARRAQSGTDAARAGDLITLILKKRLFSSPAAFALTLESHLESEDQDHHPERIGASARVHADVTWMDELMAWDEEPGDNEPGSDDERATFDRISTLPLDDPGTGGSALEAEYRTRLCAWVSRHAEPADSKAKALIAELKRICCPDGDWDRGERVIVFTEYKATQHWLAGLLGARGLGGDRLGLLYGGMDERQREHLKAAFQADPDRNPLRILLATDAASEGIDLQRHCRRVIHYDIPFNPNRLEQRIGRVDRHGQTREVEVSHFVGAGWENEPEGSFAGDLEYLSRVARKVATERQDLGSVNPVLAQAVEARMLGRPRLIDPLQVTPKASTSLLRAERDLRDQVRKLREQLDRSVRKLHVSPANIRRVVDTALALAGQPPLADLEGDDAGLIAPPSLRAGWERTVTGLADPLDGHLRPLTFDAAVARGRDNVVHAHLEYPLVAQSTRLLRSAIWGDKASLHRVSALKFTPPTDSGVNGPLVAVFARLVLVGADGRRLHEEIILSGRIVPPTGRSRRVELEENRHEALHQSVEDALEPDACRLAPESAQHEFADRWGELEPLLADDIQRRATERKERLQRELDRNRERDTRDVETVFTHLKANLDTALDSPVPVQLTFDQLDEQEQHQYDRDRDAWRARRDGLEEEKQLELDAIQRRYADVRELVFPFAVALCIPEGVGVPVQREPKGATA